MSYLQDTINKLSEPLTYKWKVQSFTKDKTKAICVAYIDARDVTKRLNEVCEHGWHRDHFILGDTVYCRLGIVMPEGNIIWRADAGESDNATEKSKTAASDSFKRAAVQFGVGLFLYDLDHVTLKAKEDGKYTNPVDDNGNKIWDLTAHINGLKKKPAAAKPKPEKPKSELDWLNPGTDNWNYAIKRIKETKGTDSPVTIETIQKSFRLSKENEEKLTNESK